MRERAVTSSTGHLGHLGLIAFALVALVRCSTITVSKACRTSADCATGDSCVDSACKAPATTASGPVTDPCGINERGAMLFTCAGDVPSCGACAAAPITPFSISIAVPAPIAQNGGTFAYSDGSRYFLDVATCTLSLIAYGSDVGASCGLSATTAPVSYRYSVPEVILSLPSACQSGTTSHSATILHGNGSSSCTTCGSITCTAGPLGGVAPLPKPDGGAAYPCACGTGSTGGAATADCPGRVQCNSPTVCCPPGSAYYINGRCENDAVSAYDLCEENGGVCPADCF